MRDGREGVTEKMEGASRGFGRTHLGGDQRGNCALWRGVFRAVVYTVLIIVFWAPVRGHVVPPENYHPVVESYRRICFVLNLNPVPWDLVRSDMERVARGFEEVDEERAEEIREKVGVALAELGDEIEAEERKRVARGLFEVSTRAVADLLVAELKRSEESLHRYREARAALGVARQLWASFAHEVKYTDPIGFRRIGEAWLEMSSSLGSPGFLNDRAIPPDGERFKAGMTTIRDYLGANFGGAYEFWRGRRLAPIPWASRTLDSSRAIPPKLPPGSEVNKQLPRPRQILNMAERGVDEGETVLIALGDMAFDSPYIFGEPARSLQISCNTCHNKSITNPKFAIPGLSARAGGLDVTNSFFAPHANNGHFDPLDIPDLRGIRFTAPYGRNGRFDSLREFVRNVIVNEFNGPEPAPLLMDGMIAYMLEFDFLANPHLKRDGSLAESALESAKRGEEIFHRPFAGMNGRSCASCHIPSANFIDHRRHDLGVVAGSSPFSRDGALDTPTLLGIKHTDPYFHDGSQPTVRGVSDWFNERFGLGLTERELGDLTSYVETVGDGSEPYEDTSHTLEMELEEFGFFLSAYEYLKRTGNWGLIDMTVRTIAQEIHAHKWDLQVREYMPILNLMAELMEDAGEAQVAGDYDTVDHLVAEYRAIYSEYAEVLH